MNSPNSASDDTRIVICTTGGTISASTTPDGVVKSDGHGLDLAATLAEHLSSNVRLEFREVLDGDSAQHGPEQFDGLAAAVADVYSDPGVAGVVIPHGTDTMEESAMRLDLVHDDPRPAVLTGAQRAGDHEDADGPANLLDAVRIAADPVSRDLGVLVAFGRAVLQARGLRKWHTTDTIGFARNAPDPPAEPVPAEVARPLLPASSKLTGRRVDVIACSAGDDGTTAAAACAAGARGVVVEGFGAGNVPAGVVDVIDANPEVVWVVTTRVPRGASSARYGGAGGGATLAESGVLSCGYLRSGQARVLLGMLLSEADAAAPEDPASWARAEWSRFAELAE